MMKCRVQIIRWQNDIAYFWTEPLFKKDFYCPGEINRMQGAKREATRIAREFDNEEVRNILENGKWRKESDVLYSKTLGRTLNYVVELHVLDWGTLDGLP